MSGATDSPSSLPAPIDALARTIYGEARGEGVDGMQAVASVIMNRAAIGKAHPHFGDGSVESACRAPWQFSCWNPNDPNCAVLQEVGLDDSVFAMAVDIAAKAINGQLSDRTIGATYYKVQGTPTKWAEGKTPCAIIGHHEFYKNIA